MAKAAERDAARDLYYEAESIADKPMFRDSFKRRRCRVGGHWWRTETTFAIRSRSAGRYPHSRRAVGTLDGYTSNICALLPEGFNVGTHMGEWRTPIPSRSQTA